MKRIAGIVACLVVLIVTAPVAGAQGKLEGVWKVVERTGPNARTITNPQPALYMFTNNHFSFVGVLADSSRPDLPQGGATDVQKVAAWEPFNATAGTYEIEGNTFTIRPLVAKTPNSMAPGSFVVWEFKIEGNTLIAAPKTSNRGPVSTFGFMKLVRVE
jgi:hypothetical protein